MMTTDDIHNMQRIRRRSMVVRQSDDDDGASILWGWSMTDKGMHTRRMTRSLRCSTFVVIIISWFSSSVDDDVQMTYLWHTGTFKLQLRSPAVSCAPVVLDWASRNIRHREPSVDQIWCLKQTIKPIQFAWLYRCGINAHNFLDNFFSTLHFWTFGTFFWTDHTELDFGLIHRHAHSTFHIRFNSSSYRS